MMNDEFKSTLSEIDNAGGQRAKRGGSTFKPAGKTMVLSRLSTGDFRVEVLAARPRGEAMLRLYSSRRPRVRRKGLKRGRRNGIIPS